MPARVRNVDKHDWTVTPCHGICGSEAMHLATDRVMASQSPHRGI